MFVDFNILNQLGSPSINSNTFANRPAAGQTGRLFVSTDTFEIYRDNGTGWDLIGGPGAGTITGTGTATQVAYFTGAQTIGSSANLFWDNTAGALGINTATPGAELDVHGTGTIVQVNATGATSNAYLAFQRTGTGVWRIGDTYNGGSNFFELHNTVLTIDALEFEAATNKSTFLGQQTYASGLATGNQFTYNLTVPNGVNITSPNAVHAVNSYLNLSLGGNTTVPAGARQGLEGNSRISFTGAGTLTMTQGSTVRAFSALSSVYSFNGSAVGTVTHLAGLRICFPDNIGSAINVTNNYGILINDQTTGLGTVTYTNRWGIYQEGANDLNYFNGNLLVKTTTNAGFAADINGTARVQSFTTINATTATNGQTSLSVNTTTNNSTGGQMNGINSTATVATNTGNFLGINSRIDNSSTAVSMLGFNAAVNVSANTTTQARGFAVGGSVTGTGTVTTYVGYDYLDTFKSGSGAITTQNAIRIASLSAGSNNVGLLFNNVAGTAVTGTWDIYAQSGNLSYFAGNVLLNTTTNAGFRLDCNGTARVTSTLSTIGQNIAQGIFFWNEGALGGTADGTTFSTFNQANAKCLWFRGDPRFHNNSTPQSVYYFGARYSGTAATYTLFNYMTLGMASTETFGISSGTSTANVINIILPYNYTGGTTTLRGIYYNPTLTSMTGVTHRAIETATGDVILGSTSGSTGIGATTTINASAILQVTSTTQGFLPPRMTTAQKNAIAAPAAGLTIYDTTLNKLCVFTGVNWETVTSV